MKAKYLIIIIHLVISSLLAISCTKDEHNNYILKIYYSNQIREYKNPKFRIKDEEFYIGLPSKEIENLSSKKIILMEGTIKILEMEPIGMIESNYPLSNSFYFEHGKQREIYFVTDNGTDWIIVRNNPSNQNDIKKFLNSTDVIQGNVGNVPD